MLNIDIVKKRIAGGRSCSIRNWDAYLAYLEDNGLPKPPGQITVSVLIDVAPGEDDEQRFLDSLEGQVPSFLGSGPGLIGFSIQESP